MPTPPRDPRTTESALEMPSVSRVVAVMLRTLRRRCPNCGQGRPQGIQRSATQCDTCRFRFTRGDDAYFSGAMFFGMLLGETLAVVAIVVVIIATWPSVPWTLM